MGGASTIVRDGSRILEEGPGNEMRSVTGRRGLEMRAVRQCSGLGGAAQQGARSAIQDSYYFSCLLEGSSRARCQQGNTSRALASTVGHLAIAIGPRGTFAEIQVRILRQKWSGASKPLLWVAVGSVTRNH